MNHAISPERALLHAQAFLVHSQVMTASVPSGFPILDGCHLAEKPHEVFDIRGVKLFYEFTILNAQAPVASLRIAALKELGHPWISIRNTALPDMGYLEKLAEETRARDFPSFTIDGIRLTCFNYPRVGLFVTLSDKSGNSDRVIIDPGFPNEILREREGASPIEGAAVYSVLDRIESDSSGRNPALLFERADNILERIIREGAAKSGKLVEGTIEKLSTVDVLHILRRSMGSVPEGLGPTREEVLEVPLLKQRQWDYCVIASIEMLLKFWKILHPSDQDQIRDLLVQPPKLYAPGGLRPDAKDQEDAFNRCFSGAGRHFDVSYDPDPNWKTAVKEIERGCPLKSAVISHSRVCAGYLEAPFSSTEAEERIFEWQRYLWINDPDPEKAEIVRELFEVRTVDPQHPDKFEVRRAKPLKTNYVLVHPDHASAL